MPIGCECLANGHAGPPRRRDGSGLGVAILPALDAHEKPLALGCLLPLMWPWDGFRGLGGLEGLEGFRGLGAGKRQAWTPIRSH